MDYVAIDFETANERRSSACAVGVVVVKDGVCAEKISRLIRPPELRFNPFNTSIHGICAEDVKNEPEFCDLWDELRVHLDGRLVLAHNAAFDMSVLRAILDAYRIPYPELAYHCTLLVAKKVWPGLPSYRLGFVAHRLGVEFEHHKAVDDAFACAEVFRLAYRDSQATSFKNLVDRLGMEFGLLYPGGYVPARLPCETHACKQRSAQCRPQDIVPSSDQFDRSHPLFGRTVVFTGTLESMVRADAMQKVVDVGGRCGNSVTKVTDYLVVGCPDFRTFTDGCKSGKLRRAEELASEGYDIEIVSELDLLQMLCVQG